MPFGEFQDKVSSAELELWMALELVRQDECPSCGIEPRDMEKYARTKQHCPVCKSDYFKVRPWTKKFEKHEEITTKRS